MAMREKEREAALAVAASSAAAAADLNSGPPKKLSREEASQRYLQIEKQRR